MSTLKRLWAGFGFLAALLTAFAGVTLLLHATIRSEVREIVQVSRPRAVAAREIEINILFFANAVLEHERGQDSVLLGRVQKAAGAVDQWRAVYDSLARTNEQRELGARFGLLWRDFRAIGQALIERGSAGPRRLESADFRAARLKLEQFLDNVMQPDAIAAFDADRAKIEHGTRTAVFVTVLLLIVGVVGSLVTGLAVSAGVVRAEAAIISERNRLESTFQSMTDGVAVFDLDGNLVQLNQALATMNGFANPEEMKRNLAYFGAIYELSALDGTLVPVEQWPAARVLRGETIADWELRGRRRDTGQEWYFSFAIAGAPT